MTISEELGPNGVIDKYAFSIRAAGRQNMVRFDQKNHTVVGTFGKSYKLIIMPGNEVVWNDGSNTIDAMRIAHTIVDSVLKT